MARATWSGFLSFGLVSVPVELFTATTDQTVHFNQLHKGTSNRVRYKKVDEATGDELSTDEIVNGFPIGGGEYVIVTREELKEAAPGKSEVIEISDFVDLNDIDPKFFRQTYYLAPKGKGADRAYALLRQAMREAKKVAIATLVLRDKEHLVAIRSDDEVLMLETMYFEDEIRNPREELPGLPQSDHADTRELAIAKQLVDSLSAKWDPSRYKNTYRERIEQLVERKRSGHAVATSVTDRPKSNVIDLMSALEASLAKSRPPTVEESPEPVAPTKAKAKASATHEQQTFAGMSKAELLARAEDLKIEVSAKMTKLQLVQALTDAQAPPRRRGRRVS
jgi:DNA end-binding protein Ku